MHVAPLSKGLLSLTKPEKGGRVSRGRMLCVRFFLPVITVVIALGLWLSVERRFRPVSDRATRATRDLFDVKNGRLPKLPKLASSNGKISKANAKSPFSAVTKVKKPWKKASANAILPFAPDVTKVEPAGTSESGLSDLNKSKPRPPQPFGYHKIRPVPGKLIFFDWRKCLGNSVCCRNSGPPTWNDHRVVNVNMMKGDSNPRFAVCAGNERDIASNEIVENKSWKIGNTEKLIAKLSSFKDDNVVLITVGANFGWTTMIAAYAGFRVIAFEPLMANVDMLRHSMCLAPKKVRERVTLMPYGLGHRDQKCELWAQTSSNRRRDAVTVCRSGDKSPRVQRMKVENFQKVGAVYLKSLDRLMNSNRFKIPKGAKVVMQFNLEGFEPFAIMGAKNFINKYKPTHIYTKFCRLFIERSAQSIGWSAKRSTQLPAEFLKAMRKYGYKFNMPKFALHSSRDVTFVHRKYKPHKLKK